MPETLSPEERALQVFPAGALIEWDRLVGNRVKPSIPAMVAIHDAIAQAIRSAEAAARADEREACARVAGNAEQGWNARIALKGRIGDSDVYASGAANAAGEIAAAIRARSTTSEEGGRNG